MKWLWILSGMLAATAPAHAQQPLTPVTAGGSFHVSGFAVEGRILLRSDDFTRVVSPYVGPGKSVADIEAARRALQDTYSDLGHCAVRVKVAQPQPRDGMVTFLLEDGPAGESRDCLPTMVLDEPAKRAPAAGAAGRAATAAPYAYTDVREPVLPVIRPGKTAAPAAPRDSVLAQAPSVPASAASAPRTDAGAVSAAAIPSVPPSARAPDAAVSGERAGSAPGASVAPYVEGGGGKGLTVVGDGPAGEPSRSAALREPGSTAKVTAAASPPPVAHSASQPAPGEIKRVSPAAVAGTAGAPAAAAVETRRPAGAPAAEAAQLPPSKPVPAAPIAASSPVEPKPQIAVPAIAVAVLEPAKAAPSPPSAVAPAVAPAAVAPPDERARPAALSPDSTPPATQAPTIIAQAESAKPGPGPEQPAAAAPRFEITRFMVQGNTLLKQESVERALAPYKGPGKDFGDVQRALDALQHAYRQAGYGGVEVRLPEQELDRGVVQLRVIEPRIGRVTVEGNEHFSEANVRRSVPGLREGETPHSGEISQSIRLANENPSKQSAVVLRTSDAEDRVDAVIRVADIRPTRFSVSLDNTGNEETHRERLGLAFQHSNVFDRDHVLTAQIITSPANFNDVQVFGVGYRIPIYSLGDSVEIIAGYSNVDSGTVENIYNISGAGSVYALRYNQNLPRWGDLEHRITYALDYRAYQNDVTPVGGNAKLVPDITVHPFSVTYSGAWRSESKGELSYYVSIAQNIPGGSDGEDEDFKQVGARFPDGTAGYRLFRTGVTYSRPIAADWQFRARVDGQYSDDALVSGEMFAIGGADSVRGFDERYTSNDKGYRTSWEIYTPDMAKYVGLDGRLRMLAFYDQGTVRRNKEQSNELSAASLDSGGLGLRLNYKTNLTLRLDVAYVFHDGTQQQEYNGKRSSSKGHFSMAWVW